VGAAIEGPAVTNSDKQLNATPKKILRFMPPEIARAMPGYDEAQVFEFRIAGRPAGGNGPELIS